LIDVLVERELITILRIDTGSSDIWVESSSSDLCTESDNPCQVTGTFNRKDSSTYERVSGDFQISYVDGEFAQGDYGKDVFQLGGDTKITGLQFGIGLEATSTEGILGIGFPQNEVQVQRLGKAPYSGLTDLMVEQKLIKSRAFSLWLNDLGMLVLPTLSWALCKLDSHLFRCQYGRDLVRRRRHS
jgi:hypothetical protein